MLIKGQVAGGAGEAAFFTQLGWVQAQCRDRLGFNPWPGTLNLHISEEEYSLVVQRCRTAGYEIIPPGAGFCPAWVLPVTLGGLPAAFVLPDEQVNIHGAGLIEILAPCHLRTALGLSDGDMVSLSLG